MSNDSSPPSGQLPSHFTDEMAQYVQVYIDESEEELEELTEAILKLEANPGNTDALHKAFRILHSLKGSSGMLGFEIVGNFAHELESRFEKYRSGASALDKSTATLILKCVDYFREFVSRLRAGAVSEGDPSSLLDQLQGQQPDSAPTVATAPAVAVFANAMSQSTATPTLSGGIRITVRFRPGLQLADLKARLIVTRLTAIGEILCCDPPIDDVASFEELPLLSLTLVTDRAVEDVRRIASVDGVEALEIHGEEITTQMLGRLSSPVPPENVTGSAATTEVRPPGVAVSSGAAAEIGRPDPEPAEARSQASETLRVDIGRLDQLMNLTGELVVSNARLAKIAEDLGPLLRQAAVVRKSRELTERLRQRFALIRQSLQSGGDSLDELRERIDSGLEDDLDGLDRQANLWEEGRQRFGEISGAVEQLTRVSRNLQRGVLNTRMVPVAPLFNRFKRVVRDLSVERRKQVQLIILGEKTELDKRMIDALGDPLLHLIRNSLDHGLESPEERRAAGKPDIGTLTLEAAHRGNNVLITVRDDGGGLNTEKIVARAVQRGLVSATQAKELTHTQAVELIWQPGFSTADTVTEISGRGVGMDIVRSSIAELNGTIDVVSSRGLGTSFQIRLPLTLAIIHSLLMRHGENYFSIPIDDVREIVSVPAAEVRTVHRFRTIDVRGTLITLVSLRELFTWSGPPTLTGDPGRMKENRTDAVTVVVIHSRGKLLGLSIDSLVGRADLVIKSLSENYQSVRGLSGASVLGDGAVCLMLDSSLLFELAAEGAQPA